VFQWLVRCGKRDRPAGDGDQAWKAIKSWGKYVPWPVVQLLLRKDRRRADLRLSETLYLSHGVCSGTLPGAPLVASDCPSATRNTPGTTCTLQLGSRAHPVHTERCDCSELPASRCRECARLLGFQVETSSGESRSLDKPRVWDFEAFANEPCIFPRPSTIS
jgi:hypothetical protein